MITFSFKVFFTERIKILQTSETIILNISWSASILCFSLVEEDTSTQNGGTESFRYWPQQRKLGFHPWPEANQIYTYPWPKAKQSYIHCGWLMISFLQVGVLKFHLRITRLQFCLVYWLIIRGLSLLVSQTSFSCRSESSNKSLVVLVISSACTADFSLSLKIFTRREKLKAVINFNSRCIWLFYNEIGAVAQCTNNWGVGSAFHRMKIHICICIGGNGRCKL